MLLLGEAAELTSAVAAALTQEGYRCRMIIPGSQLRQVGADRYEVDLDSPESLRELRRNLIEATGDAIGAVISFLAVAEPADSILPTPRMASTNPHDDGLNADAAERLTLWAFQFLKEFANDLVAASADGGGAVLNVTALDGQFGLGHGHRRGLQAAGLLGLFKSFRHEYQSLSVKNIDLDPHAPAILLAPQLIEELTLNDDLVEVGLTAAGRVTPRLKRTERISPRGALPLNSQSVVLITGGAMGITFAMAQHLAVQCPSALILVGRTPRPTAESEDTRELDETALRRRMIHERRTATPAEVERDVKRILKNRQLDANLAALEATGANIEYHALDVRDAGAFGSLIEDLYQRYGRLDGVIHGAGVIEDKRFDEKSAISFQRVFSTKVVSAAVLARALRPESLKFLVFFSSVSGRFGNAGQADYSAANEWLNKLAGELSHRWPCRVVAINWGAWDAGMVSDELRRLYSERGLQLIPVQEGVRFLEDELRRWRCQEPEVTIACSVPRLLELSAAKSQI